MNSFSAKQYSDTISELKYNNMIDQAIEKCCEAISLFPDDNFFYKILGDLYRQKGKYDDAAMAYLCQLKRLSGRPQHFRGFARFYRELSSNVSSEFLEKYQGEILDAIKKGEITQDIQNQLIENFGEVFITDKKISQILYKSDDDRNLETTKQFLGSACNDEVKIILTYQINSSNSSRNIKTREYLISIGEKKEIFLDTLHLIGKILKQQNRHNPTIIRTLLRISRKMEDYSYAESVLNFDNALVESSDFNIQYELVYYFDKTQNDILLNKTLCKMQNMAERSLPIAQTLYNFYLNFNRFEDAQVVYKYIQKMRLNRKTQSQRNEQQMESDQVVRQKLEELVSEQEHNRQMIALRDLLKGFSHELGQPITNIRYQVQLQQMKIQRNVSTSEEINELFTTILEQTARIGNLLDRFRPIVSSKNKAMVFSVNNCVTQVFNDLKDRLKRSKIVYQVEVPSDIVLFGDQIQFSQVFYNLVLNSMQAIENGGTIRVQAKVIQSDLVIRFSDNGPGIPNEYTKKIFEPFFSTKDPTSGNGGEGLGLYIVWNVLRMYNGTIQVNYKYHRGAQFVIKIPYQVQGGH